MTKEQQAHAEYINDQESKLFLEKYKKGAIEHKGKLWEVDLLTLIDNLIEEILDLKSYAFTTKTLVEDLIAENIELKTEIKRLKK